MNKQLFHYTKLDTLRSILENKKIRFTSLSEVDDLEEDLTGDLHDYGKHAFVACFTDDKKESIPMWTRCAENGQGVRLKFKGNIFDKVEVAYKDKNSYDGKEYTITIIGADNAFPIEYTEDEQKIHPRVEKVINGELGLDLNVLGKYKRASSWAFQNEWRYRLFVHKNYKIGGKYMSALREVPMTYYDVEIKENVINNLEITLGYNIDNENMKKVKHWVGDFNIKNKANITTKESCFLHKVR